MRPGPKESRFSEKTRFQREPPLRAGQAETVDLGCKLMGQAPNFFDFPTGDFTILFRFLVSAWFALLTATVPCPAQDAPDLQWVVGNMAADSTLNVRSGPSTSFAVVLKLAPGSGDFTKFECVLLKPDPLAMPVLPLPEWCAIAQAEGPIGWVNAKYLVPSLAPMHPLPMRGGYRSDDDPCRVVGESAETVNFLDHTATLLGCPEAYSGIAELLLSSGGKDVARLHGYVLISVPNR